MLFQVPGPCVIKYGNATAPVDFGTNGVTTQAGVTIASQMLWQPIQDDANGEMPIDWIFGGRNITVSFILNNLPQFVAGFFPGELGKMAGVGAGTVFSEDTEDRELWIIESDGTTIWKAGIAIPADPSQMLLSATEELKVPLEFKLLPQATGKLFYLLPLYLTAVQT